MTDVVVEVGPGAVRGPNAASPELVSLALECLDDELALLDDRPVSVEDLWRDVMCAAAGRDAESIAVVCPTWWPSSRIGRVRAAAEAVTPSVTLLRRTPLLRADDPRATVVEIADEFVSVSHPRATATVVARRGDPVADAEAVAAAVGTSAAVVIDAPPGVGAQPLAAATSDRLRSRGIATAWSSQNSVRDAAQHQAGTDPRADMADEPAVSRGRRGAGVVAGILSALMLCGSLALRAGASDAPADDARVTLLAEGRVAVLVPSQWRVQRITEGPGSARVQVVSPTDADIALHLTQSMVAPGSSLQGTADLLRAALDGQPDGVFVDFNPADRRADRPAVTYREIRPQRHVAWVVLVDEAVRIAVGCQSAPERERLVTDACDRAVRSAHAIY